MKRIFSLLLILCLLAGGIGFAAAEQNVVLCLNCTINGETAVYYEGYTVYTAIAAPQEGQCVKEWRLNGETVADASDFFFIFTPSGSTVVEAILGDASESDETLLQTAEPDGGSAPAAEPVVVKTIGASIQYLDINGVGAGSTYTELDFTNDWKNPITGKTQKGGTAAFKVTADNPHTSSIDYWVIDGVRYCFSNTVKSLNVTNLTSSMTIECVYKNGKSKTQGVSAYMQKPAEGERLIVQCGNAKMRHVKNTSTNNASAFTEFDFTDTYKNEASGKKVSNGTIDFKITANLANAKSGTKVKSWEIDGAKIIFNTDINYIIVQGLNVPKTYIAHYDGESDWKPYEPSQNEKGSSNKSDKKDDKKEETKPRGTLCTVDCRGCTFSGGGYSGGKCDVPVHTTITVQYYWYKNLYMNGQLVTGKPKVVGRQVIYYTYTTEITKWTIFEAK